MNDIQKKIDGAYKMISSVSVSGDAIEVIAGARIMLREAYNLAAGKEGGEVREEDG